MTISPATLPHDNERLKKMLLEMAASHTALEKEVASKETSLAEHRMEISHLREQLRLLLRQRFGPSSEQISREQLALFLESEASAEQVEAAPRVTIQEHTRGKKGRKPIADSWPRVDVIHDLPAAEKFCPHDGQELRRIGEETSEQLSYLPAKIRVLRHVRLKYACPHCEEGVKLAPLPPQPIPKSMASPSLLAHVAVSKYADALPLYRQSKMLERIGIELPRTTLANWMIKVGDLVQPLVNLMRDDLLSGSIIQCDETRCQVLKEPGKSAQSQSYLWVQRGGAGESSVILFDYDPSRSGGVPKRLLAGFEGYLQTDGYRGYDAVCAENPGIRRVGCWAHARRKFDEALKAQLSLKKGKPNSKRLKKSKARQGLLYIQQLYQIEGDIRGQTPEVRQEIRRARGQPILHELRAWLMKSIDQVPPRSLTGRALGYLSDHWQILIRYLEDGRLEIDNNLVENAIRPCALGRKNYLFSDTVPGAEAAANIYSLIETAKAHELEPFRYLCYVFRELPKAQTVEEIERLMPTSCSNQDIEAALGRGSTPF
jgi:transposase